MWGSRRHKGRLRKEEKEKGDKEIREDIGIGFGDHADFSSCNQGRYLSVSGGLFNIPAARVFCGRKDD